ncbi:Hypothetical predicted protein [Cloeon dipterum]|uniref:Single domain-containing protein n=1 Tax=Cloeon dipterum TaxID=197152 RepID=A0A8S1BYF6_9INSE|nr:Hypothetical predicted protein [Cloeon dipterum]
MLSKFFVIALICAIVAHESLAAPQADTRTLAGNQDKKTRGFFGIIRRIFGHGCPEIPLCPIDCSVDTAVVHGYCCGCARFYERLPVICPDWLQCPLNPRELCGEYRFAIDCCCGTPYF